MDRIIDELETIDIAIVQETQGFPPRTPREHEIMAAIERVRERIRQSIHDRRSPSRPGV